MDKAQGFQILLRKLPPLDGEFAALFEAKCELITLEKNEMLVKFQSIARKMYFIIEGSFIRNIITSNGKQKTVFFHTTNFCSFFKCYDSVYFNTETTYEIVANEKSVVLAIDFDFLFEHIQADLALLQFYNKRTEELLVILDQFRNFQLGLTSEEYLVWLQANYGFLFQKFPAQNIANFMGITNVWLSRLKSRVMVSMA